MKINFKIPTGGSTENIIVNNFVKINKYKYILGLCRLMCDERENIFLSKYFVDSVWHFVNHYEKIVFIKTFMLNS